MVLVEFLTRTCARSSVRGFESLTRGGSHVYRRFYCVGTQFKTPMSNRAMQQTGAPSLTGAGIQDARVHTLRHTLATHSARGTERKMVQETLARFLKTQENLHALRG